MSSSDKTETVELHTFQWISVVLRVVKTLMDNVRVCLSNMQKRTVKRTSRCIALALKSPERIFARVYSYMYVFLVNVYRFRLSSSD